MVKHLLLGAFAVGLLAACAGVADLDVNYTGGATTTEDGGGTAKPGADASVTSATGRSPSSRGRVPTAGALS